MDPAVLGTRMASSVLVPALRGLLIQEGPGAGLTDRPVRISLPGASPADRLPASGAGGSLPGHADVTVHAR